MMMIKNRVKEITKHENNNILFKKNTFYFDILYWISMEMHMNG